MLQTCLIKHTDISQQRIQLEFSQIKMIHNSYSNNRLVRNKGTY